MTKSGQQTVNHRAPPLAAETEFVVTPPFLELVFSSNSHELASSPNPNIKVADSCKSKNNNITNCCHMLEGAF